MRKYLIFTDSSADLPQEIREELDVRCLSLSVRFEGESSEYRNNEISPDAFYQKMRGGGVGRTAAVNKESFASAFSEAIDEGYDVLYIGFSSALSGTYAAATVAAEELREGRPEARIITVDSLCASLGLGLLVYLTARKRKEGATLDEAAEMTRKICGSVCHWFTVDDLVYLKRGGRISAASAAIGNLLSIKPILHMDDGGHLVSVGKARGRQASVMALANKFAELASSEGSPEVFISHADCYSDAERLAEILKTRHGVNVSLISDVGPVIGAHSGPGTLALFFIGRKR
nr:DegV family protein [Clostridia bacterium]